VLYGHALELDPGEGRPRIFYAAALERAGRREEARAQLEAAIAALFPADPAFWGALAWVFLSLQAPESALGVADAGLALAPDDAGLLERRQEALRGLGSPR
jgi:hypothetical protein